MQRIFRHRQADNVPSVYFIPQPHSSLFYDIFSCSAFYTTARLSVGS
jgi:hypothetical protein